jgi:hypothetical protein
MSRSRSSKYLGSSLGREVSNFGALCSPRIGMMNPVAILDGFSSVIDGDDWVVNTEAVEIGEGVL